LVSSFITSRHTMYTLMGFVQISYSCNMYYIFHVFFLRYSKAAPRVFFGTLFRISSFRCRSTNRGLFLRVARVMISRLHVQLSYLLSGKVVR
jgi:hypothetical protein